jgi:hypothetical protein
MTTIVENIANNNHSFLPSSNVGEPSAVLGVAPGAAAAAAAAATTCATEAGAGALVTVKPAGFLEIRKEAALPPLDEKTKEDLARALEEIKNAEMHLVKTLPTREMRPNRENKGKVRVLVLDVHQLPVTGREKPLEYVSFLVMNPAPDMEPKQQIYNGNKKLVSEVNAACTEQTFHFMTMQDTADHKAFWEKKGAVVVDEVGEAKSVVMRAGSEWHMRLDGVHGSMQPFTIADFWLTFTICVSDPKKPLKEGEPPTLRVSKAIKQSQIIRSSNLLEIPRFFRNMPAFCGLPLPSVAEIMKRNRYVHKHVMNEADQSPAVSSETITLPVFRTPRQYVEYWGGGAGAMVMVAEDSGATSMSTPSADNTNAQKQSAFWWAKFATPNDKHRMLALKGKIIQYAQPSELLSTTQIGPRIFPHLTFSMAMYENMLGAFKINSLWMWERMAPSILQNVEMFLQGNIKLYQTYESPANNVGNDRFATQHLFFQAKAPVIDLAGELLDSGAALPVSASGAERLLTLGHLMQWPAEEFAPSDQLRFRKRGEPINMGENPPSLMLPRTRNPAYRFAALLSKPTTEKNCLYYGLIKGYMVTHPDAVGAEVLLWDKFDPTEFEKYLAKFYADVEPAKRPTLPEDHPILMKYMRSERTNNEVFVLYAIDIQEREKLEKESTTEGISLVDVMRMSSNLRGTGDGSSSTATPAIESQQQQQQQQQQLQLEAPISVMDEQRLRDIEEKAAKTRVIVDEGGPPVLLSELPPPPPPYVQEPAAENGTTSTDDEARASVPPAKRFRTLE